MPLYMNKLQDLITRSIRRTNNSAAGPDGVPYAAYRKTIELSSRALTDAMEHMYHGGPLRTIDGQPFIPEHLSYVIMVCLPKKVAGAHPQFGDLYTSENTRPLSIVNTDNRILAIAGQIRIESRHQMGIGYAAGLHQG